MCGFAFTRSETILSVWDQVWEGLQHRGPDSRNEKHFWLEGWHYSFCHTRLAINDLSEGSNQPFHSEHGILLFNGEIYNFRELRDLHPEYPFTTSGDTEVVAAMIKIHGLKEACKLFRGMYAIAYFNNAEKTLSLARDDYGIKPLYYSKDNNQLIVSSSLDTICSLRSFNEVDKNSLAKFFCHRYIFPPSTIYQNVFSLEPGQIIHFGIDNSYREEVVQRHKSPEFSGSLLEAVDQLDELLISSISEQVACDVPVAVSVSGGLDSSLIAAICFNKGIDFQAYSFKHGEDDVDWLYANLFYENFPDIEKTIVHGPVTHSQVKTFYEKFDQPIGDSSSFPILKLSECVSEKYKVLLCGDGADELFGGYLWHSRYINYKKPLSSIFSLSPIRQKIRTLIDCVGNIRSADYEVYKKMVLDRFSTAELQSMKLPDVMFDGYSGSKAATIKDILELDQRTFMQMTLSRTDLASMAYSVEARVPYLDKRIVSFASALPEEFLINGKCQKYILQEVAKRYLPEALIYRPKRGFGTDLSSIMKSSEAKRQMDEILSGWLDFRGFNSR